MPPDDPLPPPSLAGRLARVAWIALIAALLLVYFVFRPNLGRWLGSMGVSGAPVAPTDGPPTPAPDTDDQRSGQKPDAADKVSTTERTSAGEKTKLAGLKDVGGNVKVSPAGLRYTPGSEDGHRLKHVLHHAKDDPERPGKHGVFDGGDDGALATIDEAYELAKAGGSRVRKRREGDRTIYEVNLGRRIGYLGGQEGQRLGHPATRQVRLVLEGTKVITAFPF
jgi:hypothetical protein